MYGKGSLTALALPATRLLLDRLAREVPLTVVFLVVFRMVLSPPQVVVVRVRTTVEWVRRGLHPVGPDRPDGYTT